MNIAREQISLRRSFVVAPKGTSSVALQFVPKGTPCGRSWNE